MIELRFPQWPTHVAITKNKRAPDRYVKVNSQGIYNGAIARFGRNVAVKNLHKYFLQHIPRGTVIEPPVKIKYIIKTVVNHGSIMRRNNKIHWKYPDKEYIPNWDIENLAGILIKTGNDSLVKAKVIPDDSIEYLHNIEYEFQPVRDLEDREIIIQIYTIC